MQIQFMRWCLDVKGRNPVSVDPSRVDATEHFSPAFDTAWKEHFPAATKLIMKNKQEYIVQGELAEVVEKLNEAELQQKAE